MRIKNPDELKERETGYGFMTFWEVDTERDECIEEGSPSASEASEAQVRKDLNGLCYVCCHYKSRAQTTYNPNLPAPFSKKDRTFGDIKIKDLAKFVAEHDNVFAKRVNLEKLPDMLVDEWVYNKLDTNKNEHK